MMTGEYTKTKLYLECLIKPQLVFMHSILVELLSATQYASAVPEVSSEDEIILPQR